MIPQNKNQPGPPGRITIWGHPWHGLVEDGTLTLPNSTTMDYAAPTGLGEADVLAFQPPGTPAVVRNPTQAAADAAAGRQWLDYALISGRSTRRLYGQAIGGNGSWLYAAPDGSRWLVTLADVPGTHDLTAAWETTLTLDRFGDFGAPAQSHTLAVSLADWQQTIPGHPDGDYYLDGQWGEVTSAQVEIEDVRRDGSGALLSVHMQMTTLSWGSIGGSDYEPIVRLLIGTVELTITGTPGVDAAAALAVRRSRVAMLGTLSWSESPAYVTYYHTQDHVWVTDPTDQALTGLQAMVGSRTGEASHTGRVMAVGYDDAGQMLEITLNLTEAWSSTEPAPPDGENPTRVSTGTKTATATLTGPAGEVSVDVTLDVTVESHWTNSAVANTATSQVALGPLAATWLDLTADNIGPFFTMGPTAFNRLSFRLDGSGISSTGAWPLAGSVANGGTPGEAWLLGVRRYSATCLELVSARVVGVFADHWDHFGAVSMTGAAIGLQTFTSLPVHQFGSAHPVTGEIARARDVRVCWV